MVTANEFRVDNWVYNHERGYCQVNGIQLHSSGDTYLFLVNEGSEFQHRVNIKDVSPIPITPEILRRCGLVCFDRSWGLENFINIRENARWVNGKPIEEIKYVVYKTGIGAIVEVKTLHQLQNIYFALFMSEIIFNHINPSPLH